MTIQETRAFVVQWQRMYALCVSNCSDEFLSMSMRSAICVCTIRILAYFDFTSPLLCVCVYIISLGILSDSIIVGLRYVYLFFFFVVVFFFLLIRNVNRLLCFDLCFYCLQFEIESNQIVGYFLKKYGKASS